MTYSIGRRTRLFVIVFAMVAVLLPLTSRANASPTAAVFINEIHYDNAGSDTGEMIEIAGPAGTDLSAYSVVLYNGSATQLKPYGTVTLSGLIPDEGGTGFGALAFAAPGMQNGSPDGLVLAMGPTVVQFLSYEGSFTANEGIAAGMTSTDIGVSQNGSGAVGQSLQLTGTGNVYGHFAWQAESASSFGTLNAGQTYDSSVPPPEPPPDPTGSTTLVINEIDYDQPGTDASEFVEILNISEDPIGLAGWTLEMINGANDLAYRSFALPDVTLAAGDYFVVCGNAATTANCDLDVSPDTNLIQNGAPEAIALLNGSDLIDTVSYEGDVPGYVEGSGGGLADLPSPARGISRLPNGGDLDSNNTDFVAGVCVTPGDANTDETTACAPAVEVMIHEVQGAGGVSPLAGERVIVEGIVVQDEETFDKLAGFFVQEEDADVDGDVLTSEGVFVFNHAGDDVSVGDLVRVEGTVEERFGNTQLTDFVDVTVVSSGNPLPSPAYVSLPQPSMNIYESFEGMVVKYTHDMAILEYYNYDRFGSIIIGKPTDGARHQLNPTAVFEPGSADGISMAADNMNSRITVDDYSSSQNPEFNLHPIFRNEFTADNAFRGGDVMVGLSGAIYYTFGEYKLYPNGFDEYNANERPGESAPNVGGRIQVATLNALNYFLTIDSGPDVCGPNQNMDCRGADNQEEFDRQRAKLLRALVGLNAEVIGLVEIENTTGVEVLKDLVNGMNDAVGTRVYDYVDTGTVGTDAIKAGVIYNRQRVQPVGKVGILDTPDFLDPNGLGDDKNRAALAVTFNEKLTGQKFSVVVNHLKSKGSPCGPGDDSPFAGSCNVTRTLAAEKLAEWLETKPTGHKDADWLIVGDLNAYDKEDPIDALRDAGYTDLIAMYDGEFAYSFVFDGQAGYLDYIMSSETMTSQVTRAAEWHINADEPDLFDYDTRFKADSAIAMFDGTTPYRSSDHDAAIVGLSLTTNRSWPKAR